MGKNQTSVVLLQIRVKFWCTIPMGVKYNHTKFERETQRWRPETGFASGGPQVQELQFRAKNSHFWAKKALEHIQNSQTKGNRVPFVNRPFESEIHGTVNFTYFCCLLLVTWCHRVLLSCYLGPK